MATYNRVEAIVAAVAEEFKISREELLGRCRKQHRTAPRMVLARSLRDLTPLSYPVIGKVMGRHHTTVLYLAEGCKHQVGQALPPWMTIKLACVRRRLKGKPWPKDYGVEMYGSGEAEAA
jgi:Bacterial dnaA protein helix-turn-helix